MTKNKNTYIWGGLGTVFLLYLVILFLTPAPIDWRLSFSGEDSIPYGSKILFEELGKIHNQHIFETNNKPIYNYSENDFGENNFVIINQKFHPDKVDLKSILDRIYEGAVFFIAASNISENVLDSLQIEYDEDMIFDYSKDQLRLNFVNERLKTDSGYVFKKAYLKNYFTAFDSISTTILGIDGENRPNFIKMNYGDGAVFINLNPLAFTNYNMLEEQNYEYVFKSLSYIDGYRIVWDEYYKENHDHQHLQCVISCRRKLYVMLEYLTIFGILLYLIFGAKRRQRTIPVFEPPKNTTISFINTIGALYFKRKNHRDIAQKKYNYFLEFLRSKYYIDTSVNEHELIDDISQKLEVPERSLKKLFSQGQRLKMDASYTEEDLEQFTKNIDFIYQRCKKQH